MSSIFKTRKTPRHLIIEDETDRRSRSRHWRLLLILAFVVVLVTVLSRLEEFSLL